MTVVRSAAFAFLLAAVAAAAQQPPPLTLKSLKSDVYITQGQAGGNVGIVVGKSGVVAIDASATPESARQLLAEVAKVTPKPVTHVILTSSVADYAGGLGAFPANVTIVAHENVKTELDAAATAAGGRAGTRAGSGFSVLGSSSNRSTRLVVRTGEAITIEDVKFELRHWAPAHTSGDLVVSLPDQKIVFTGGVVAADRPDPSIALDRRGSSEGWITTVKGMLGLTADQFAPGRGGVLGKAEIQARLSSATEARDTVAALLRDGKSLDEIRAAVGTGFASFAEVVVRELNGRR